jgi:hypothetical protein
MVIVITYFPVRLTVIVASDIFREMSGRRSQVAKAADCKSAIVGSTPTDASSFFGFNPVSAAPPSQRQRPSISSAAALHPIGFPEKTIGDLPNLQTALPKCSFSPIELISFSDQKSTFWRKVNRAETGANG